jgi:hypothetical protein
MEFQRVVEQEVEEKGGPSEIERIALAGEGPRTEQRGCEPFYILELLRVTAVAPQMMIPRHIPLGPKPNVNSDEDEIRGEKQQQQQRPRREITCKRCNIGPAPLMRRC